MIETSSIVYTFFFIRNSEGRFDPALGIHQQQVITLRDIKVGSLCLGVPLELLWCHGVWSKIKLRFRLNMGM